MGRHNSGSEARTGFTHSDGLLLSFCPLFLDHVPMFSKILSFYKFLSRGLVFHVRVLKALRTRLSTRVLTAPRLVLHFFYLPFHTKSCYLRYPREGLESVLVARLGGTAAPAWWQAALSPLAYGLGSAWLCGHSVCVRVRSTAVLLGTAVSSVIPVTRPRELQLLHSVGFGGTTPSVSSKLRNKPISLTVVRENSFMLKREEGHLLSCPYPAGFAGLFGGVFPGQS